MKPSFSREIVPNEKSFFFIDMKGIPNKENINNKNLIISKIPKKKQNKTSSSVEQRFATTMKALISRHTQDESTVLSLVAVEV